MKRILVPTDFSQLSEYAVDFAVQLAKPLSAEVSIVHFEEVPLEDMTLHLTGEAGKGGFSEDDLFNAQLFRANKNKLREMSTKYSRDGVHVTGQQLGGGFLKGVQHFIDKNGADLVVLGTTGEESIQELFSGNHTEQLIEQISIPVISVQQKPDTRIKDIVLGIDLMDEKYSKKAFDMVKIISESLDASVHIVNIIKSDLPADLMFDLNKLAKIVGLKNYTVDVVTAKKENEALMDFADQKRAGLVIALSDARSGLYRFIQHSFATKLTRTSKIPVLTINKRHLL